MPAASAAYPPTSNLTSATAVARKAVGTSVVPPLPDIGEGTVIRRPEGPEEETGGGAGVGVTRKAVAPKAVGDEAYREVNGAREVEAMEVGPGATTPTPVDAAPVGGRVRLPRRGA